MNRRGFLSLLGMGAAVSVAPKFFFAPVGGWRSDVIFNPQALIPKMREAEVVAAPYWFYGLSYWIVPSTSNSYLGISRTIPVR